MDTCESQGQRSSLLSRVPQACTCLYKLKGSSQEKAAIDCFKETNIYMCGRLIFPEETPLQTLVIVRKTLVSSSPIEAQYYNAVLVHIPPVCYFCGLGEEGLVDDDEEMRMLQTCYIVVLPSCFCVKMRETLPTVRILQMLWNEPKH